MVKTDFVILNFIVIIWCIQMEKTVESLNWIVKALVQQQMGADKAPPVFKTKEQRQKEGKIIVKYCYSQTCYSQASTSGKAKIWLLKTGACLIQVSL